MECVILSENQAACERYVLEIENLSEAWRCFPCEDSQAARRRVMETDVLILQPCRASSELLAQWTKRPMMSPPYLLGDGFKHPMLDGWVSLQSLGLLPDWLEKQEKSGILPRSAAVRLPEITCLARGLLRALSVPMGLTAWSFLPDMVAMAALHPALLRDLRSRLYPLSARRSGMTPVAVERSLRLCIESAWSRGKLESLERFFGQSVDPERGKPTNREFLIRVSEQLSIAARRLE